MAQALSVHQAVVKFAAGKTFQTSYGDRINVVLVLEDGEEIKLWGNPNDPNLTPLKKGQRVTLAQGQKGWQLVQQQQQQQQEDSQPAAPSSRITHTPLEAEEKKAIAAYIDQLGDLFGYCQRAFVPG